MGVADDLHAGADEGVLADDDVPGDRGAVEQHRAGSEDRLLVAVGVEGAHVCSCLQGLGQPVPGVVGEAGLLLAEHRQANPVVVGGGADGVGWAADEHRRWRDHPPRAARAGPHRRCSRSRCGRPASASPVADLAPVADGRADDLGPVTEDGSLTDPHGVSAG